MSYVTYQDKNIKETLQNIFSTSAEILPTKTMCESRVLASVRGFRRILTLKCFDHDFLWLSFFWTFWFFLHRVLKRSWLSHTVLWPRWACFPSSTPHPCCPSPGRTTSNFRNSSREPPRKRLLFRHRSLPHISAPAFPLWTKRALTLSTVTTRPLPRLQRHRSASTASSILHGSLSGRCINMWHPLTHSVQLMAEQQGSHLRRC